MASTTSKSTRESKAIYVNHMFNKIAHKYDLLNNLMTFGFHYKWKEETIKLALKEYGFFPQKALDVCSGTGDLAIILNKHSPNTNITIVDNSNQMLEIAQKKIQKLQVENITVLFSDVETMPYNPSSFDLITIGFGLRNLVNKEKNIEHIHKILKKGGVFSCIDLGHPLNYAWRKIYFLYLFKIVPILGEIFAHNKEAYTYLPFSLMSWYTQEELKELILKKGFQKCYFKNIFGGAVAIHIAVK